ncbi:MAG: DUF349 domain-containing protein [Balneolaceae bacterium]
MSHEERKVEVSNLEQKNIDSEEAENNDENTNKVAEESLKEEAGTADTGKAEVEEENNSPKNGTSDPEKGVEQKPEEASEEKESEEKEPEGEIEEEGAVESSDTAEDDSGEATQQEPKDEEVEADPESETSEESETDEDTEAEAIEFYSKIVERAKELVVQTDWAFVSAELGALAQNLSEGPDTAGEESKKLIDEFQSIRSGFEEKKKLHYEELNKKKAENLAKKKELLASLAEIISEEKWTATKEVGQIRGRWESIKMLPPGEADDLNERYANLMQEFEDHKVDRLVKKLQQEEENLELKFLLLDKMDALNEKLKNEEADFDELNKEFEALQSQWRKVGRVPSEKNQALWDRFNAAQDAFSELRFKHDKKYREQIEKALGKKKKLVKEAEALVDQENIAQAARKVNKLHKAWKNAGNLPQKEENEMWDLFKAATDAFNEKKSENIDVLREQEEKNLEKKQALIQKAEETKGTDNFDAGHQTMQNLMSEWKKIGPVPRKRSSKIWKKFKGAMDEFYDRRRANFKELRQDQKENLSRKQEILEKLGELGKHDDPALAVEEAKKLQQEFKDAGHVPIKMKNKIWKQYREACDVIYERYRALGSDLGLEKKLAKEGVGPDSRKEIIKYQKEVSKLKKDVSRLEGEVIQFEEAQTYFKPTNKGNVLRDELQEKIDKAKAAIEEKRERLYELDRKIDDLKDDEE